MQLITCATCNYVTCTAHTWTLCRSLSTLHSPVAAGCCSYDVLICSHWCRFTWSYQHQYIQHLLSLFRRFDAHCCHVSTAINKASCPVPDRVTPSFVIFWHSEPWSSECPDVKNYKWRLNPVWHRTLYSCTHGNSGRQRVTDRKTTVIKLNWRFLF